MTLDQRLFRKIIATAMTVVATPLSAQFTAGTVSGRVTSPSTEAVAGAQIVVVLTSSGERYATTSHEDGKFIVANVKPGGPYRLTVQRLGFGKETRENIVVALGQATLVNVTLAPVATQLASVNVVAQQGESILSDKTTAGPSKAVGRELIDQLPSLSRSIQDLTRLTPASGANSFGSTSYRYNNVTIDGAASNDVFGFSASAGGISGQGPSGTPGAGAKTQPISLDAVQAVQVVLAPFDVRLGNFTGGSVNVVTRSGTNDVSGSVFTYGRNQASTGRSADASRTALPAYSDYQVGGRLGGPIVTDKAFFFMTAEVARRDEPVGYAPGSTGTVLDAATAKGLYDTLKARYNYDAGSIADFKKKNQSTKLFGRLDFNLSDANKLNIRHNSIDASAQSFERTPFLPKFGGQDFTQYNLTNSTVAELKSTLSDRASNSLIASLAITDDHRSFNGQLFPQLEITGPSGSSIFLGTDREASVFKIGTKVVELSDNLTLYRNKHTITLGSHNELYALQYTFLNAYQGRWAYSSIANFYANRPSRIRGQYDLADDSYAHVMGTPQSDFHVYWPALYAQDEIAITNRFTVTGGLRVDAPILPDKIPVNPLIAATPAFAKYTNTQNTQFYVAPRVAFTWDVNGDQSLQLRGGTGVFAGRAPFAWLAYPYENTGLKLGNVDCRPSATSGCAGNSAVVPLVTDGQNLKSLQTGVFEANLLDNNFKFPTVWRSSMATDYRLPGGYQVTLEGMYTQVINDVKFLNVGLKDTVGTAPVDQRPIFLGSPVQQRVNPNFTSVFLVTNTNRGFRYNLTGQLRKSYAIGVDGSFAYTYGQARDVGNGVRNSPQSNWEYNQVPDVRNPNLAYSDFDIRHRVVSTLGYQKRWGSGYTTSLSGVFSAVSGSPFTFIYASDANRDGTGNNDLIYVPRDEADARIVPAAGDARSAHDIWLALDSFIRSQPGLDALRGQIAPRNTGRTPWNRQLDVRILQDIPVLSAPKHSVQVSLDIINFGALLGTTWGRQYFVPNEENYNFKLLRVTQTDASGAPTGFSFDGVPNNTPWQYDNLTSRYQAQLGLRYTF